MAWKSTLLSALILHLLSPGAGQNMDPDVLMDSIFPPARPSLYNLNSLCLHGKGRFRYTAESFPPSSFAHARRAGKTINRLEAWFGQCCYEGLAHKNGQMLCCAKQAWETALSYFCLEEFSTKTLVHECCERKGGERWDCFEKEAPNPYYQPLPGYIAPIIPPDRFFTWDPNAC
ncbi:extracellular matrix protein 1 [Danio aesculapii]|uniref:extracellular matrix protein 1 n=1 Tax=Danio aesculapii TaxID=1142201 RepID=UPI0024C0C130|nr:extracellular matrix protein 1 [Danio aesculapii]